MSVARRLVVGLAGADLSAAEADWLRRYQPAGVILFGRNCRGPEQLRALVTAVRSCLAPGAELCADHEGGAVSFLAAAAGRPPAPRTLGDLDDPDLTTRVHAETGARLRDLGLDRVLAPCCDVLTEPRNPVIGSRAFGATPARVAAHAAAAARGLQAAGLRGCAKHWPGHGGTGVDTHDQAAAADKADQRPFAEALAAGLDAVMVGHLPLQAGAPPASVDPSALASLRAQLGNSVTIWCDDISMGALRPALASQGVAAGDGRTEGLIDPAVMSLSWLDAVAAAGADRLLLRGIPWAALPLDDGRATPLTGAWPPAVADAPSTPAALEARQRTAAALPIALEGPRLLWVDATTGERLGEARGLESLLRRRWPALARLDAAAPQLAPHGVFGNLLVTSLRPLTVTQAVLLEPLLAATGEALVAGHPSLAADVARLAGPGWVIGALRACDGEDLACVVERPGGR